MSELDNELAGLQEAYAIDATERRDAALSELKTSLEPLANKLAELESKKTQLEIELKATNIEMKSIESEIRTIWGPHIAGADKARINIGNIVLEIKETMTISTADKESAIKWLMDNGYQEVMKWDLHTQTMYKIAREHYDNPAHSTQIPGLKYETFQKIKVV